MGPNMARLLKIYWDRQKIVPRTGRFLRKDFRMGGRVTQGDPVSPMIFSIVVYAVVRAVLDVVCGPQYAQYSLGWAAVEIILIFKANDVRITVRDHDWVQDELKVKVEMFSRMGL